MNRTCICLNGLPLWRGATDDSHIELAAPIRQVGGAAPRRVPRLPPRYFLQEESRGALEWFGLEELDLKTTMGDGWADL